MATKAQRLPADSKEIVEDAQRNRIGHAPDKVEYRRLRRAKQDAYTRHAESNIVP